MELLSKGIIMNTGNQKSRNCLLDVMLYSMNMNQSQLLEKIQDKTWILWAVESFEIILQVIFYFSKIQEKPLYDF